MRPAYKSLVQQQAAALKDRRINSGSLQIILQRQALLSNLSEVDIEALVFLVMMQTVASAQEELRFITAGIKEAGKVKQQTFEFCSFTHSLPVAFHRRRCRQIVWPL